MPGKLKERLTSLIALLTSIAAIVFGYFAYSSQMEFEMLKTQIEFVTNQKADLEKQIDPAWAERMNQLRIYYDAELNTRDKRLHQSKKELDSLTRIALGRATPDGKFIFTPNQVRKILIKTLQADRDSVMLLLADSIILLKDSQIQSLEVHSKFQDSIRQSLEGMIKLQNKMLENEYHMQFIYESMWPTYVIVLAILAVTMSVVLLNSYLRRKT